MRAILRAIPNDGRAMLNLAEAYFNLDRVADARALAEKAYVLHKSPGLVIDLYHFAVAAGDQAAMEKYAAAVVGKPWEPAIVAHQAESAYRAGRIREFRQKARRAMDQMRQNKFNEGAAILAAEVAASEASCGFSRQAREGAREALAASRDRGVRGPAGWALAFSGETGEAKKVVDELERELAADTYFTSVFLPILRAAIDLNRGDEDKAIERLSAVQENAGSGQGFVFAALVRGLAYLEKKQGAEAAREFQRILALGAPARVDSNYSLLHLHLARAYALAGDTAKARETYQKLFELWKDADPDFELLKDARKEYSKL